MTHSTTPANNSSNAELNCEIGVLRSPQSTPPLQSVQSAQLLAAAALAEASEEAEASGSQCSKCSEPLAVNASICGHCGYYETAGIFVELQNTTEEPPEPFSIPWYVFLLPVAMLLVVAESVACAYFFHPEDPDRTLISVGHLLLGMCLFIVPHLRAQIKSMKADPSTEILDFVFRPFRIWGASFEEFPKSFPWLASVGIGLTGIFCSLIILRAFPDPFVEKRTVPKSSAPVLRLQMSRGGKADSLEDAINDFANKVEIVEGEETEEVEDEANRHYLDCVIVGYNESGTASDQVSSIVLAVEEEGQYRYVSTLSKGLTPDLRVNLKHNLAKVRSEFAPLNSQLNAIWVKPGYRCRVWYTEDEEGNQSEMNFDRMLFF